MKTEDRNTSFWEPGFSIFGGELNRDERKRLAPLEAELEKTADPARSAEIKRQIAMIESEFKTKRKNARFSLFAKT